MQEAHPAKNYDQCAYVYWKDLKAPSYTDYAKNAAEYMGWRFDAARGEKTFCRI